MISFCQPTNLKLSNFTPVSKHARRGNLPFMLRAKRAERANKIIGER
ncbi:MAG: hypothetical protein H0W45_00825 [Acidobacteria bacterium]|nr:hypothetical protein [Acidobacteriota bacterium]